MKERDSRVRSNQTNEIKPISHHHYICRILGLSKVVRLYESCIVADYPLENMSTFDAKFARLQRRQDSPNAPVRHIHANLTKFYLDSMVGHVNQTLIRHAKVK